MTSTQVRKPRQYSPMAEYQIDYDFTLRVSWDPESDEITFASEMPADAYLAIAFGARMDDCDMLVFQSGMAGSSVRDCVLSQGDAVDFDGLNDWSSDVRDYGSRRNKLITARRPADTLDEQDFAI